ncbi:hypothetical protein MX572_18840 [Rhodococcus pyridinivorans]|uniref:hypothetical protein n=1 Tax=Rhodococcus pyridinivorans TaxID=103816 RepID=UPI0020C655EE|nr:hypothetical protein [Rhodococcus pyridinivorans]UTM36555.1 hypothetical protein MX572_18840 [Rhodococcus pyridinivorans]
MTAALVAASERVVTAGGRDQKNYHYPTIEGLRSLFPSVDVVDVQTATSPLYHLMVSWAAIPLGSSLFVTQVLGSFFGAALVAVLVAFAWPIKSLALRALVLAPLFLSAYFWQSTLWLNTDVATLFWAALALLGTLRAESVRDFALVGVFCCLAVATRQTAVWLLIPVTAAALMGWRGRPLGVRVLVGCAPAGVVLLALVAIWGGLTPPAFAVKNNDVTSYAAVSYGFAVLAFFAVPLAWASIPNVSRNQLSIAGAVGFVAAIPAVLFPSAANSASRTGGWVWSLVGHTPDLAGRSPLLIAAAFLGGLSSCLLANALQRRYAVVLATSFVALCAVLTAGSDLYQRYFELPVALLFMLAACDLAQNQRIIRQWPLFALAAAQGVLLIGIVIIPLAR